MMAFVQRRKGTSAKSTTTTTTTATDNDDDDDDDDDTPAISRSMTVAHTFSTASRSGYNASARRSVLIIMWLILAVCILLAVIKEVSENIFHNKLQSTTLRNESNSREGKDAKAKASSNRARGVNVTSLNAKHGSSADDILDWICDTVQQGEQIVQLTSFGISSLVILDKLRKHHQVDCLHRIPVVFIDTLHLFPETYQFLRDVSAQRIDYGIRQTQLHVYRPEGFQSRDEFDERYGKDLYMLNPEKYGLLTKAEPTQRALHALHARAWITGRRRSQGSERSALEAFERDGQGRLKINPLVDWTYEQVWDYIRLNNLPYNPLFDQGYKSIGDVQSTSKVTPDAAERSGRFQGLNQTECGMHVKDIETDMIQNFKENEEDVSMNVQRASDTNAKDYWDLNPKSLYEMVLDEERVSSDMLLVFYSPRCGHCRAFMPTFLEVARHLRQYPPVGSHRMVQAGRFNVLENRVPDTAKTAGLRVAGVPTIFLVQHEPFRVTKFIGRRDKDTILKWLGENGAIR